MLAGEKGSYYHIMSQIDPFCYNMGEMYMDLFAERTVFRLSILERIKDVEGRYPLLFNPYIHDMSD